MHSVAPSVQAALLLQREDVSALASGDGRRYLIVYIEDNPSNIAFMQDLMEESGCYVFLTHEATGVAHRNTLAPAIAPNGTPIFHAFKSA